MQTFIELKNLTKRFGNVIADNNVSLKINHGEIYALVGENGAGKSTLMNLLYGLHQPDSGTIYINGKRIIDNNPTIANTNGIGMVHQHFKLVPSFTVAQNITLANPPKKSMFYDYKKASENVDQLINQYGLIIDPDVKVESLPVGAKQKVEILKTLYGGAKLLILDEPTAVLTPKESIELYKTMRSLVERGKTIIFISHKLKEVLGISDRITVMRRGQVVGTYKPTDVNIEKLASVMMGNDHIPHKFTITTSSNRKVDTILNVENISVNDDRGVKTVKDLSFRLFKGEIVGIAGVEGNGQNELADAIAGLRYITSGRIYLHGNDITKSSVDKRRKLGFGYIPEDRQITGISLYAMIEENLLMGFHRKKNFSKYGFLNYQKIEDHTKSLINQFDIRTSKTNLPAINLSGGNMQKLILARELSEECNFLIASQPTRGLDIGAINYVHHRLVEFKNDGNSILLISSDLDEILKLSDRILVMYKGKVAGTMDRHNADENNIGILMAGGKVINRK